MAGLGKAPLTSDIGLVLEIAVIVILIIARYRFARRGIFDKHGQLMAVAVGLHAVTLLLVMIPSLALSLTAFFRDFRNPAVLITWVHVPSGALTLILAFFLIVEWRFRSVSPSCYKRARLMRPLWWLWLFAMILGVLIFVIIAFF